MNFLTKSEVDEARRLNKLALVNSRRTGDEEAQKRLSQERESLKRHRFCWCGVRLAQGRYKKALLNCSMHNPRRVAMKMKNWLAAGSVAMFTCLAFAPSPQTVNIPIGWNYDFLANPTCTGFNIYVGTNNASISNWDGYTNTCRCYQSTLPTGTTNCSATITGLPKGQTYYVTVTPTSSTEEGPYCNEVRDIIPKGLGKASTLIIIGQ